MHRLIAVLVVVAVVVVACSAQSATTTSSPPERPSSTTPSSAPATTPSEQSQTERALINAIRERDADGVWVGWADGEVLVYAHKICDIADLAAELATSGGGLRSGEYLMGTLNDPAAAGRDLIRVGGMLGALSAYPLCSQTATSAINDAVAFVVEMQGGG